MELKELKSKEEMLQAYDIMLEVYPTLTLEEYSNELDVMTPHNYGQIAVIENGEIIGLTGYWLGSKLWCGRYLELDNVVVSKNHQKKGIGKMLFDYAKEKAEEHDCTMLALDSYSDNFEAHKFFYKQDFVPRGFHFINILRKDKVR